MENLRSGSKGEEVKIVQQALIELGYLPKGSDDGGFGPRTEAALIKWEQERYADAEVSSEEFAYFKTVVKGIQPPTTAPAGTAALKLPAIPKGYDGLIQLFGKPWEDGSKDAEGNPDGMNWWAKHQAKVKVPEVFNFNKRDEVYVNAYIAPVVAATFEEIARCGLAGEIKTFDGCFKVRPIRGYENANPPRYSIHTWGMAIDVNAAENGLGVVPKLSPQLVACFKKFGWVWGGDFKRLDGMHWQYAVSC